MLTIEQIRETVASIAQEYNLKKVTLFGSRANGTARADSDVDLIIEFENEPVTLLKLISLKHRLEDIWNLEVDAISRGGIPGSILIIEREIDIYAA